ncbi:MAG: PqqD family protein [Solirubrobacteraceae bacterium]
MTPFETRTRPSILDSRVEVPGSVVYRSFVAETVILNLETGRYHGVNPIGGYALDLLRQLGCLKDVAARLSVEYGVPVQDAADDLSEFCRELAERGLIRLHPPGSPPPRSG